ncbi:MAG: FAD-dependent oxidoreductase [Spongiibacteraceae bacterium]
MTDASAQALPEQQTFDVAIIGGGIHGAGVAQASAAAGYRTLLIERGEWAAATSRSSSKLIHGGLRYLESAQFNLVRHSLRERTLLLRNAPELVRAVPFYIPIYRHTRRRPWQIRIGLTLYALLAGLHPLARFRRVPQSEWATLPGLRREGLQTIFQYWDAQTDDAALTRAVVQSAAALGAICLTGCELQHSKEGGGLHRLQLRRDDHNWQCSARSLVNAAGPWVNEVAARCENGGPSRALSWVKGTHIVLPTAPPPTTKHGIFYLEAPRDGRAIFVMPWHGKTLVGTTEVEIDSPGAAPTADEIAYLLETLQFYFPQHPDTVLESFAGVRVLPADSASPFGRARESVLARGGHAAPIVSIYGGKLTTWRHTAEQVLAALRPALGYRPQRADTRHLPLPPMA